MMTIGLYKIKRELSFLDKNNFEQSLHKLAKEGQNLSEHLESLINKNNLKAIAIPLDLVPQDLPKSMIIGALSSRKDTHWIVEIQDNDLDASKLLNLKEGSTLYAPLNVNMGLIEEIRPDLTIIRSQKSVAKGKSRLTTFNKSIYTQNTFDISVADMVPPTGSGIIAFLIKKEDIDTRRSLLSIHDKEVTKLSNAERKAVNKLLELGIEKHNFHCYEEDRKYHIVAQSINGDHRTYKHTSNTFLEIEDYIINTIKH